MDASLAADAARDVLGAVGDLLIALAGGGLAALGVAWSEGQRHGRDVARVDADRTLDALVALRKLYRDRAFGAVVEEPALRTMEDALDVAARRVSGAVAAAAATYVLVGRLYASRDPATGEAGERDAFDRLADALVAARRRR